MSIRWQLIIGGSQESRIRWHSGRVYRSRRAAHRRAKQIICSRDMGIETVWILMEVEGVRP